MALRRNESLALLFFDLDHFKEINDSLGHPVGDALLVQVADQIRKILRKGDTLARISGDEFTVLLPEAGQDGAAQVASNILAVLRKPVTLGEHQFSVTGSVGISLYPRDGSNFDVLFKNADAAMYQAKRLGRDAFCFYDPAMNTATLERFTLMSGLRKAVKDGQLRTYFQPKIRLADRCIVGAEALVRWQHPDMGLMSPELFIPVAEKNDLIVTLGQWVLEDVCQQLATWRQAGLPPLTIALNMATRHFQTPRLAKTLAALLAQYDLTPDLLELELTESTVLKADSDTLSTLEDLQQLGISLAIDDFGTGYSNLAHLKNLPLASLKIDNSFIQGLATASDNRVITATIVSLGHNLGLTVVAEGVETEQQCNILMEQSCDLAQGYLFSPPLPAADFADWLVSGQQNNEYLLRT